MAYLEQDAYQRYRNHILQRDENKPLGLWILKKFILNPVPTGRVILISVPLLVSFTANLKDVAGIQRRDHILHSLDTLSQSELRPS